MAGVLPAAAGDDLAVQVLGILGVAGPLADALGRSVSKGQQLSTLIVENPSLLRKWSAGRGQTVEAQQQRAYAKLILACLEATNVVDVGSLRVAPSAPAASVGSGRFTEPDVVVRTKKRAVFTLTPLPATTSSARSPAPLSAWASFMMYFWRFISWAPRSAWVVVLLLAWLVLTHPEVVAVIPVKVASWLPLYIAWAMTRVAGYVENEILTALGFPSRILPLGGSPPQAATSHELSALPFTTGVPLVPRSAGVLGWLTAARLYLRHT